MNVVFIVPTGIGAEIGGHAGDATPSAKLIASVCDTLFVHPNVVNASDINEMSENMLYVEGSLLDRFLEGLIGLEDVYQNKILLAVNHPVSTSTINAVNGARATIGADIEIVELHKPIRMTTTMNKGQASGELFNIDAAVSQVNQHKFDVLVVQTPIESELELVKNYLHSTGGTNLWGGVEARLSAEMSEKLNRPVIHAPIELSNVPESVFDVVSDSRKAAEMVSVTCLHCCLKGAHLAPKISMSDIAWWNTDIEFMVSPIGVYGRPHIACQKSKIPVIVVRENKTVLNDPTPDNFIVANNYLEVAGIISARKAGVSLDSIRRPLLSVNVEK